MACLKVLSLLDGSVAWHRDCNFLPHFGWSRLELVALRFLRARFGHIRGILKVFRQHFAEA